ncbi:transporter substrate-binding domain-containing protein [Desulfolutivibrio sp.]|uniref:transporter substrate-binding domain-containing protein n=1 Tax=Desulfolutivibrio sp. TaxID=2773296 RepID=UPI002F965269
MGHVFTAAILAGLLWGAPLSATAQTPPPSAPENAPAASTNLKVGTTQRPPFSYKNAHGEWEGISIDLWQDMADEMGYGVTLEEFDEKSLLQAVEHGRIDAAVTALSITPDSERHMDFTHPYYLSGLGIAVPNRPVGNIFIHVVEELISPQFLIYVGLMGFLLMVSGLVVWWIERRLNPDQFGRGPRGIVDGMWWSAVTMTTVGYGDAAPKSIAGRLLGMAWMFASVVLVSVFTASVTTTLTVGRIEGKVNGPADLPTAAVGCVSPGTAEGYLRHIHARPRQYTDIHAALAALAAGDLDAVVDDRPFLLHTVREGYSQKVAVLEAHFDPTLYGFAFPLGSALRKPANVVLLRLRMDRNYWKTLTGPYLGE